MMYKDMYVYMHIYIYVCVYCRRYAGQSKVNSMAGCPDSGQPSNVNLYRAIELRLACSAKLVTSGSKIRKEKPDPDENKIQTKKTPPSGSGLPNN